MPALHRPVCVLVAFLPYLEASFNVLRPLVESPISEHFRRCGLTGLPNVMRLAMLAVKANSAFRFETCSLIQSMRCTRFWSKFGNHFLFTKCWVWGMTHLCPPLSITFLHYELRRMVHEPFGKNARLVMLVYLVRKRGRSYAHTFNFSSL